MSSALGLSEDELLFAIIVVIYALFFYHLVLYVT